MHPSIQRNRKTPVIEFCAALALLCAGAACSSESTNAPGTGGQSTGGAAGQSAGGTGATGATAGTGAAGGTGGLAGSGGTGATGGLAGAAGAGGGASCSDGATNGDETDTDCGGSCPACDNGKSCNGGSDCTSAVCSGNVCKAPACDDGVQNAKESDIDCGGDVCQPCPENKKCGAPTDCDTLICNGGVCTLACSSNTKNGNETDVDCGGSCPSCGDGKSCLAAADCQSKVCDPSSKKCLTATCSDSVKNGSETDVDCGGSCIAKCGNGKSCTQGSDCSDGVCTNGACLPASCGDSVRNGDESDVDCGGSCSDCGDGKKCGTGADCSSQVCDATTKTCSAPTCGDGVKNATETDVDCGGSCTTKCADTKQCSVGGDCQSKVCDPTAKKCSAPACNDNVQNGSESDTDCGGSCSACADGKKCSAGADCSSLVCDGSSKTCLSPTCNDNVKNGSETDKDCGGSCSAKCADGLGCATGADCVSLVCDGSTKKCLAPTCSDGVKNSAETDVDCGGGSCPVCAWGKACSADADCNAGNGVCTAGKCWPIPIGVWEQRVPANPPLPRSGASVAYDPSRSGVVLFGGDSCGSGLRSDVWLWNGSNWSDITPSVAGPTGRYGAGLAYDEVASELILVGGATSATTYLEDTWALTSSGWQSRAAAAGGTRGWPGLAFHGSSSSGKLTLFGGTFLFDYFADTQTWSGSAWSAQTLSFFPTKRMGASFEHDSARGRTVMFGGSSDMNATTTASSETWEWDGSSWSKKTPAVSPPPRYWASSAFDSVRKRTIVTFGMGASGHEHDTWEWDGNRWLKTMDPAVSGWWKNSAYADTMTFDPVRRRALWVNTGTVGACTSETYEYYALATPCSAATDCAVGTSCVDGLCSKQASCGTCEATNTPAKPGECASVVNADDPDTCTGAFTCNALGQCVSK